MTTTNESKNEYNTFTIRMDSKMQAMINYLKEKKNINKTAIIKLAIAEMYNQEKAKDVNGDE